VGKIKNLLSKLKNLVWHHKIISIVVIVVLLVIGFLLFPKNPKPILTQAVSRGDVIKMVSVTGKVDSSISVNLTFQTPETLSYVGVKLGDSVKKYQLIASLDQNQLQASLRQAQQQFTAAKAASQQYYDNHTNATESDSEKVQRTAIDSAQNQAYDQIVKVQHDIANSSIYAPIAGIMTRMDAQTAGVNVTPATVFTITDPTTMVFSMDVDEADIGNIQVGQPINVSLDAFPNTIVELKVLQIDFVSHLTTSGGTAFTVKAALPFNNQYRVGISGNADIITSTKHNVLNIPLSSVMEDNTVYVQMGKNYLKKKITLGLQSDTITEVRSGLSQGEIVAVDPSSVPQQSIVKK
jgi:RND family efflux transporter MFP subunit